MKFRDASLIILISILIVCGVGGYVSSKYLGDDNPVEEIAENIIEKETGAKIDLTPATPEK